MAGLVVSALLGVGAKVPASMDAPVREVFHTPPGMSAPIEPLLPYQASQDEKCCHWVDSVYNRMNLREKVGQLFIYTIAPVQTKRNMQLLRDAVHTYKVGGLLFSGGKIQNQATLTNEAQRMARCPLLITFDGEWGLSMRLRGTPVFPRNMVLGCIQDNRLIYEYGREMARQCREMGVQVNFAPVADVNINPDNPVINTRSFGEDPVKVADKVIAYASGGRVVKSFLSASIFRDMVIRTWILIRHCLCYHLRASAWTVLNCILLKKLFVPGSVV